jgi:hypothetical protein
MQSYLAREDVPKHSDDTVVKVNNPQSSGRNPHVHQIKEHLEADRRAFPDSDSAYGVRINQRGRTFRQP